MSPTHDIVTLQQIIQRLHRERFPDMKPDRYFEHFVAEQILKERDLTDAQLLAGNTGGPNEGGIDALHLFVNGDCIDDTNIEKYKDMKEGVILDLHLIQAKDKDRIESGVINTFSTTVEDLLNPGKDISSVTSNYNSAVIQVFQWFWDIYNAVSHTGPKLNITFSYATKAGNPTKKHRDKARQLEKKVERQINGCNCKFQYLGATELLDLSRAKPPQIVELIAAEPPLAADEKGNSYLALVRLDKYYEFITSDDGGLHWRLFEANVRDWQGNNKVNNQIQDSLREKDDNDFWWLNNGITLLVKSVISKGKTLQLENPEIVNGLQTTRAIWRHFRELPSGTPDERRLLTRIIDVGEGNENRETIIRATNSQTAVPTYALRSLDRVHRNIEEYFLAQKDNPLFYDRRKNFYKNQGKPSKSIIDLRTLAQAIIATGLGKPDDARGRPSDYLGAEDDERYRAVFDDDTDPAFYFFCATFYKRIDELLKNDSIDDKYEQSQRSSVRFHIMTHVITRHMKLAPSQLPKAINTIAQLNIENIDESLILSSISRVLDLCEKFRQEQESSRMKWSEFEDIFFVDLNGLLAQQKSP
ncbi:MAG: AIPR family protein [Chloroflexi bacterium]|nr:AIPR family protein [Chloroflexota bacterium]